MYLIGLDAGTTSISGVLLNVATGRVEHVRSCAHAASIPASDPDASLQDPERIYDTLETVRGELVDEARRRSGTAGSSSVAAIGVTGQVHGIVYVDDAGRAVSPLYTWQDLRARRPRRGGAGTSDRAGPSRDEPRGSWAAWAREQTGYAVASGYGLLTHAINTEERLVPTRARGLTTILGYLTMRLTGATVPRIDPTDAHSLGLYSLAAGAFDDRAVAALGIERSMLPTVAPSGTTLGTTADGVRTAVGTGDNQAGVVGAVLDADRSILVNVGTSSQLSMVCRGTACEREALGDAETAASRLEVRPFPGDLRLLSGAALCGGSAIALLESFFRDVCRRYADVDPGPLFDRMVSSGIDALPLDALPAVRTQFLGTRDDPDARGAIAGLGPANLTPEHLTAGFLHGVIAEIASFAAALPVPLRERSDRIVAVGNGLRRNPLLRRILGQELGLPVVLPESEEEAALGAAIIAGVGSGVYATCLSDDRPIRYLNSEETTP